MGKLMYVEVDRHPVDGAGPDFIKALFRELRSKVDSKGHMEVLGGSDPSPTIILGFENPLHYKKTIEVLTGRNIDHKPHKEPIRSDAPQSGPNEIGVMFFRLNAQTIPPDQVRKIVLLVARTIARENGGTPVVRSGIRKDQRDFYWVGFNLVPAGQMFASYLKKKRIAAQSADVLPGGDRPRLKLVDISQAESSEVAVAASGPGAAKRLGGLLKRRGK